MRTRNRTLDVGRAFCVLLIVGLHHVYDYVPRLASVVPRNPERLATFAALAFFFMVSGFLLAGRTEIHRFSDTLSFWKRRLVRILPLYLLALFLLPFPCSHAIRILSVFGINNFLPGIDGKNIPTLWFVSQIVVYYLVLPGLLALSHLEKRFLVVFSIAGLELLFFLGHLEFGWDCRLWWFFPCFAAGVMLSKIDERHFQKSSIPLALLFFLLGGRFFLGGADSAWFKIPFLLCGGATIYLVSIVTLRVLPVFFPFFRTVAYSSFAAYLFHRPLYSVASQWISVSGTTRVIQMVFLVVPSVFVLSYLIQSVYDSLVAFATKSKVPKNQNQPKRDLCDHDSQPIQKMNSNT